MITDGLQNCPPRPPLWALVLIGLLGVAVYVSCLGFDFLEYDDRLYVVDNPAVLGGLSWDGLHYAFTTVDGGSWMPLTWLSHQLDSTLFGAGAAARHAHNLVLHLGTALMLGWGLQRWQIPPRAMLVIVLCFTVHPLRNESVAWIAERKDVLSGFCFMLGLLTYQRYRAQPTKWNYSLLLGVMALGLMAKPMLVTFPFVLLLLDFWPLQRFGASWAAVCQRVWGLARGKIPLLLLAVATAVATYHSQRSGGAMGRWSEGFGGRWADIVSNYWFYFHKTFWPDDITILYPPRILPWPAVLLVSGLGLAVTVWCLRNAFRWPWLVVGWLWFVGMLVPVVGVVPVGMTMVADRYTYLPTIGLWLALICQLHWFANQWVSGVRVFNLVGALGVAILSVVTWRDLARWRNTETLFTAALRVAPHKIAYNNLGSFYIRQQDFNRAAELATAALELDPHFGPSYSTRAMAYASLGNYALAKQDYDEAIRLGDRPLRLPSGSGAPPRHPESDWLVFVAALPLVPRTPADYLAQGIAYARLGDTAAALADFNTALTLAAEFSEALFRRSGVWLQMGNPGAAVADAQRVVALRPDWPDAYAARANALLRLGDYSGALADQNRCLELAPTNALYFQNRAVTHFQLQQWEAAWADVKHSERLGGKPPPSFIEALSRASGRRTLHQP